MWRTSVATRANRGLRKHTIVTGLIANSELVMLHMARTLFRPGSVEVAAVIHQNNVSLRFPFPAVEFFHVSESLEAVDVVGSSGALELDCNIVQNRRRHQVSLARHTSRSEIRARKEDVDVFGVHCRIQTRNAADGRKNGWVDG